MPYSPISLASPENKVARVFLNESAGVDQKHREIFLKKLKEIRHPDHTPMKSDGDGCEVGMDEKCQTSVFDEASSPFMDMPSLAYTNSRCGLDDDPRKMYPWKYRKKPTKMSAFVKAARQFILINSWREILFVWFLVVLPLAIITERGYLPLILFPYDAEATTLFFTVFTFFISVYSNGSLTKLQNIQRRVLVDLSGQTADMAILITAAMKDTLFNASVRTEERIPCKGYEIIKQKESVSAFQVYWDIALTLTAMPYAYIYVFDPYSTYDLEKLPLKESQKDQIRSRMKAGASDLDAIRGYLSELGNALLNRGLILAQATGGHNSDLDGFGGIGGNAEFDAKIPPIHPVQRQIMYIALLVFCASLPISLYQYWGLQVGAAAYYIVLFVLTAFIIGFFQSNQVISNPFAYSSAISIIDLKETTHQIAENAFHAFCVTSEQLMLFALNENLRNSNMVTSHNDAFAFAK